MSPTGWPMMVTAILLAVAAPIGTYLVVEPDPRAAPGGAAARLSMIGLSQVMAILLCGVVVNNYYGLYASWDDLVGQTGSPGVIIHQNAAAADTPIAGGLTDGRAQGGRGQVVPRVRPVGPAQEFKKYGDDALAASFTGPKSRLGGQNNVLVWLPPQYNDTGLREHRLPGGPCCSPATPGRRRPGSRQIKAAQKVSWAPGPADTRHAVRAGRG